MKTFMRRFNKRSIQDDIIVMSIEAKSFVICFRNMLKREFKNDNIEIVYFKGNHYTCSGFLKKDNKYIYFSYMIPRHGKPVNFYATNYMDAVLIRYAKDENDFQGGTNKYCTLAEFPVTIRNMFKEYDSVFNDEDED